LVFVGAARLLGVEELGIASNLIMRKFEGRVPSPPQQWTDLLDPRWQGQITLGHPGFSGLVGNWVVAMWDKHGWDYFTNLAKNDPKIARSINDTVTDIVSGERQMAETLSWID